MKSEVGTSFEPAEGSLSAIAMFQQQTMPTYQELRGTVHLAAVGSKMKCT